MTRPRSKRAAASVQAHYVRVREIMGDVLCVWLPVSPTKRAYRAVLEVSLLNFLLKAEEEQEALVERYRSLLKSLTFSLQILVCNQRLDLRPYVAQIQKHTVKDTRREEQTGEMWEQLAEGLEHLLQQVGSKRTLLERHCYVIIPAPELIRSSRGWPLFRRKQRRARQEELVARALQDLSLRVEMVQAQLAALGIRSHRLCGEELARLSQRCLTPERALQHPLQRLHLASVGHLPQTVTYTTSTQESRLPVLFESTQPSTPVAGSDHTLSQTPRSRWRRRRSRPNASHKTPARTTPHLPPPDFLRLADLLAPASVQEERDGLRIDDEWIRGIAVTAFPREVSSGGWLAPLFLLDELVDVCLHIHPQDQVAMMRQLKRRRVGYASSRTFQRQ